MKQIMSIGLNKEKKNIGAKKKTKAKVENAREL